MNAENDGTRPAQGLAEPTSAPAGAIYRLDWDSGRVAEPATVSFSAGKRAIPILDDPHWDCELSPVLVGHIRSIRRLLIQRGWTPAIPVGSARRTIAQQMRLLAAGQSRTLRSRHLTGHAADIVPAFWGWDAPLEYWLLLGRLAEREGLTWGGYWGLRAKHRAILRAAIADGEHCATLRIGWDPAHVEL